MRPHYGVLVPWEYRPRIVYLFIRIATSKGAFRVSWIAVRSERNVFIFSDKAS